MSTVLTSPQPPPPVLDTHANRLAASHVTGRLWKESNTGLIYNDNGVSWDLWKSDGCVVKTADEVVTNSDTLQSDNHLFFPIEPDEKWFFEVYLDLVGVSANADFKCGWSLPASGTVKHLRSALTGGNATAATPSALDTTTSITGLGANESMATFRGWITNAAAAGTATFQWAQNTLTNEDITVKAGSFLWIRRLV